MLLLFILCFFTYGNAQATTINGFDAKLYGFVKASAMYSTEAMATFNNINLIAPTHAPVQSRTEDHVSRMSFQAQHSRVGFILSKKEYLKSNLEFDFIGYDKSSPTTQMNPRVRRASVTYHLGNSTVIVGQDWDLFSPVTNYTFNIVGLYFMAGNTGFMRQQFQYLNKQGDWELGVAIGMAGNNTNPSDSDLELAKSPSYSARISRKLDQGRTGVSAIYARLNYELGNGSTHDSYGYNFFYEQVINLLSLKFELYYGQNLFNIGALSISKGTETSDVKEYGGTLTGRYKVTRKNVLIFGTGLAKVDNRSEITPFSLSSSGTISYPGVRDNFLTRIGWEYKITDEFSWINEVSRFETVSKMNDDQYQSNTVGTFESGVKLVF